jgi:hypothetical protein
MLQFQPIAPGESKSTTLVKSGRNPLRAIEVLGSRHCVKTQFILLLAEELKLEVRAHFYPIGYSPVGLIYGDLPAVREWDPDCSARPNTESQDSESQDSKSSKDHSTKDHSTEEWIEDFRLIWYHLEGHRLSPTTHTAVRSFLDSFFKHPFTAEQIELLKDSRSWLHREISAAPLTRLQKLYYRYVTWPKLYQRITSQGSGLSQGFPIQSTKTPSVDDRLLELQTNGKNDHLSTIKLRSLRSLELITNRFREAYSCTG